MAIVKFIYPFMLMDPSSVVFSFFAVMYNAAVKILVNVSWCMSVSRSRIAEL